MPRTFAPGHRPDQPLYPDELVYTSVAKIESFLQLPDAKPTVLAANTSTATENGTSIIKIPITGADYRRWGFATGDVVTVYDDVDALGKSVTITGIESGGASAVINLKGANPSQAYTTANNAYVQPSSILSNSSQRGISKSQVETLIRRRQDYMDRICRMAWRPRLVIDEYQNFTTFKPYRRRYYTDYVGAIYLRHRPIQRVLRMGVWQGDNYRELAASRIKLTVQDPHLFNGTDKLFLCPNVAHTATLSSGSTTSTWSKDFGVKTIAAEIGNLINQDAHTGKIAVQVGSMTESGDALNVNHEFLATANSDEGDGVVLISSMRSTDEGEAVTFAYTNASCFTVALSNTNDSTVSSTGSTFVVADGSGFVQGNGLYYYGSGTTIHVARCTRSGNNITIVDDLTSSFQSNLSTGLTVSQTTFSSDSTDEQRQKDWWSMEDNGAIMFNNQYPFFENHSIKISYVYGERYLDKAIEDACTKLVALDIMLTDDYTAMFPEGTQNIDLAAKTQKLDEEVKRILIPYQEGIIVAGMGG
tara:strand:- start:3827 stop:5419 length:1593 start_codon:yes stop_codon:yes gene_type:complete